MLLKSSYWEQLGTFRESKKICFHLPLIKIIINSGNPVILGLTKTEVIIISKSFVLRQLVT